MKNQSGIVLISTLFMIVALMAMLAAYSIISRVELSTTKSTSNSAEGFYAAEAGLNIRAEQIKQIFLGYNRPMGVSPDTTNACSSLNMGEDDFACAVYDIGKHQADTFVLEDPSNPINTTIPPGELYQNLNAQEYRYTVRSTAINQANRVEAMLDLRFKSRLVPMFQFMAFYNKDLEILPGATMTLNGPVHTNGDLYLNTNATLSITGQVSTAGLLFRGRKNTSDCLSNTVRVRDPVNYQTLVPTCATRTQVFENQVGLWNGMIRIGVDILSVPEPEVLDPLEENIYWNKADLRLVLRLNAATGAPDTTNSSTAVEVRNVDHSVNTAATNFMNTCVGSISGRVANNSNTFFNNREAKTIRLLEVDLTALFNCIQQSVNAGGNNNLLVDRNLADTSEGGLVFHFTVDGPQEAVVGNPYGIRVRNGANLVNPVVGAPEIKGITIVSDQAFYVHGNYNSIEPRKPAAFLVDSFNVLSNNWNLNDSTSTQAVNNRNATNTTVQVAILSGTDSTGAIEGVGGQGGAYNGGLENYPRFHENWTGDTFTYRGSFVSLNTPRRVVGTWVYGSPQYTAPTRDWSYDTNFNDAAKLPPLSPRFVYLRQELFVRDFEQD